MRKVFIFLIFLSIILGSCGSSKKTQVEVTDVIEKERVKKPKVSENYSSADIDMLKYIARYKDIAKREMKEFGIPASITLAQGILESQSGKSELAIKANNHFGIKCHEWNGEKYLYDDDKKQECFRKYKKGEESYMDHSRFLANRRRYAFLFRLPKTDYEAWAQGLKKAGYATDPSYPAKLTYLIEKFHLNNFDKEVLEQMSIKVYDNTLEQETRAKKFIYEVKPGETLFTISKKFDIPVKRIQEINNLNDFDIYEGQILVLTEDDFSIPSERNKKNASLNNQINKEQNAKKTPIYNRSDDELNIPEKERYVVKEGETLFSIAKKFNLDLDDLLQANNFDKTSKISVGQTIRIPLDKVKKEEVVKKNITPEKKSTKEEQAVYHVVKPGETLYRIHVNYKVSISKLRKLNHLKGNNIKVGQKIRIK